MICNRCGFEIGQTGKFCAGCGTPALQACEQGDFSAPEKLNTQLSEEPAPHFCGKCGAKLQGVNRPCLICGAVPGESVSCHEDEDFPVQTAATSKSGVISTVKNNTRLTMICIAVIVLLALSALSLWLIRIIPYLIAPDYTRAKGALIYLTDSNDLKFTSPAVEEPETLVSSYNAQTKISGMPLAKTSASGRYIAYLDNYLTSQGGACGDLYIKDFSKKSPLDGSTVPDQLIAGDVTNSFFFVASSESIVYLTFGGELIISNYTNSKNLDSDVLEIIDYNDDKILYKKAGEKLEDESGFGLYECSLSGTLPPVLVDENILELSDYSDDFDRYLYLCSGTGNREIIYNELKSQTRRTLAIGVDKLISADVKTLTALYQTTASNPLRYENLINDDFAAIDKEAKEPDIADYPLLSQLNDGQILDSDDPALAQQIEESEDLAEENLRLDRETAAYEEKLDRDLLRSKIRQSLNSFVDGYPTVYDLYICRDGDVTRLAEGSYLPFINAVLDMGKGLVVWTESNWDSVTKIPLSQYANIVQDKTVENYLIDNISESLCLEQTGYTPVRLTVGNGTMYTKGFRVSQNGDGIYFIQGNKSPLLQTEDNACSLYYTAVKSGSLGTTVMIDENVNDLGPVLADGRVLYQKEQFYGIGDLYAVTDNISERLAEGVAILWPDYFKLENGEKTLLYCEHFDRSKNSGDLFMVTKQKRQLSSGVYRFFYRNDSLVYFLRGYSGGRAELYSFSNNGLVRIDENVIAVFEPA